MTGKDDNYRGPAVRALCQITDVSVDLLNLSLSPPLAPCTFFEGKSLGIAIQALTSPNLFSYGTIPASYAFRDVSCSTYIASSFYALPVLLSFPTDYHAAGH